jgi:hypothetical protein
VVDAKGKDKRGNGTAGATVTMSMDGTADSTDVKVHTDLAITGKPAQFGRGVMQDVSDKLLGQFVACLQERLGEGGGASAPVPPAEAAPAEPATPAAPAVAAEPAEPAVADAAPEAAAEPVAPATPPPAATQRPATPTSARGSDDALDLGKTVLPVLARSYWKQALVVLVVIVVIIWLIVR